MKGKLGLALLALVALVLVLDVLVTRFLVAEHWRPLPPFGALTNDKQEGWLEREKRELASGGEEGGTGSFDPELGWVVRPGTQSPDGRMTFNARGFRGRRETAERPADGVTRVATFGDSYTLCQEVADPFAWQAILEELDPSFEVLNLGVGGYGTDQALLRARRELGALHADVALLGLLLENIGRNVNRYRPRWYPLTDTAVAKPRFILQEGRLELVPLPFASRRELIEAIDDGSVVDVLGEHEYWSRDYMPPFLKWSGIARLLGGRRAYAERDLVPLWTNTEGEPFQVTLALLEDFLRLAEEHDVPRAGILVYAMELDQARWRRDGRRYWTTLFDELDRRGIPYVDLTAPVGEAYQAENDPPLFRGTHHSRAGNTIVARAVLEWLRSPQEEGRDG